MTKTRKDTLVLLIDKEGDFRNILAFSFNRKGYETIVASSAMAVLNLIETRPVDIIILDVRTSSRNGIELLDRIIEKGIGIPVVILVDEFSDLPVTQAYRKNVEAVFTKPFDLKVLEELIYVIINPTEKEYHCSQERAEVELKVELEFPTLSHSVEAKVVRIEKDGMFVIISQDQYSNVDNLVIFRIDFGEASSLLKGRGIVRWVRTKDTSGFSFGCAIEFNHLPEAERLRVIDYLCTNLTEAN
jgi:CheY-like chemotaxis protein